MNMKLNQVYTQLHFYGKWMNGTINILGNMFGVQTIHFDSLKLESCAKHEQTLDPSWKRLKRASFHSETKCCSKLIHPEHYSTNWTKMARLDTSRCQKHSTQIPQFSRCKIRGGSTPKTFSKLSQIKEIYIIRGLINQCSQELKRNFHCVCGHVNSPLSQFIIFPVPCNANYTLYFILYLSGLLFWPMVLCKHMIWIDTAIITTNRLLGTRQLKARPYSPGHHPCLLSDMAWN